MFSRCPDRTFRFETFLSQDLRNPIEKLDQLALGRGSRDDFVFGKNLNPFTRANYPTNRINQLQNIAQRPASAYNPNIPVLGIPIGLPNIASASSIDIFILNASVIATCIA